MGPTLDASYAAILPTATGLPENKLTLNPQAHLPVKLTFSNFDGFAPAVISLLPAMRSIQINPLFEAHPESRLYRQRAHVNLSRIPHSKALIGCSVHTLRFPRERIE